MNIKEIKKILHRHNGWLEKRCWGVKADLRDANLRGANLRVANLRYANLCDADLCYANLCYADLRDANLDFSCLPLWCGGQFITDDKICKQLVAHTVRIMELSEVKEPELIKMMNDYEQDM